MSKTYGKPTTHKYCAFCQYWMGDAKLEFKNQQFGFSFEGSASGKCAKQGNLTKSAGYNSCYCKYYAPNEKVKIML